MSYFKSVYLTDNNGNNIEVGNDSGNYYLETMIKQDINTSTKNTTSTPLASGATFTGLSESTFGIDAIQTIVKSEQPITMYIDQAIDDGTWDIIDSWAVASGVSDARTTASVAPYFRVRAKNDGSFTQQYFRLATAMTPSMPVLPRKLINIAGTEGLSVAMQQNVTASTLNSSTTNLSGGGTYVGFSESTLGVAGIQVNLFTTQNCYVYFDQSMDGTNWDITDTYNYYYSEGGASWTVQATASYFRVRVLNRGSVSTTSFRLQTALCPTVEALPRSLGPDGYLKTANWATHGKFGHDVIISPMGDQKVASSTRLAGAGFVGNVVDTNFWQITSTGNGGSTQSSGELTVSTGNPTANGSSIIKSVRIARYIPANSNFYRANIRCPAVTTSTGTNTRRWGAFDEQDGFFFEVNQAQGASSTVLRLVCRKGGNDSNYIETGSFNGEQGSVYQLDTGTHTFEIYWTNKNAYFVIDDALIHTFTGSTSTLVSSLSLKIGMQSLNAGGNTAANTLVARSGTINRLGNYVSQPTSYFNTGVNAGTVLKYGPGNLHSIAWGSYSNAGAVVTLADGVAAGGSTIFSSTFTTSANAQVPSTTSFGGLPFASGLYLTVGTNAANLTVVYE